MAGKPYKAKTLSGAQAEVRRQRKLVKEMHALLDQFHADRLLLARLAADEPMFFNPLEVLEAKKLRDSLLPGR